MSVHQKTTLSPSLGMPLIKTSQVAVAVAFIDSAEGAKEAIAASMHATAILTELHIALAAREMSLFFKTYPSIQSMGSTHSVDGDDKGHERTTIAQKTLFIDGTEIPNYNYHDDDDPNGPLGASREGLHYTAELFLNSLMTAFPLARTSIEDALHTRISITDLPGKAFLALQEAFAISRDTGPGIGENAHTRL